MSILGNSNYVLANLGQTLPHNYVNPANPTTHINPRMVNMTWLNVTSGEIFTCTDNTPNANVWFGLNDTYISPIRRIDLLLEILHPNIVSLDDSSGNNNDALSMGATRSDGVSYFDSIAFDGAVATKPITGDIGFTTSSSWSLSTWVYQTERSTSGQADILSIGDSGGAWCALNIKDDGTIGGGFDDDVSPVWPFSSQVVPLNTWTHLGVTYNRITDLAQMYSNGVPITTSNSDISGVGSGTATVGYTIGWRYNKDLDHFVGRICMPRAYHCALTSVEMLKLYEEGS